MNPEDQISRGAAAEISREYLSALVRRMREDTIRQLTEIARSGDMDILMTARLVVLQDLEIMISQDIKAGQRQQDKYLKESANGSKN